MPYTNERSTASGGFDVLNDPTMQEFLSSVKVSPELSGKRDEIRSRLVDASNMSKELGQGIIYASDASMYEAVARENLPSVRVGMLKFSNVIIGVEQYRQLRDRNEIFVDPIEIAKLKRASSLMSFPLPGAGITSDDIPKTKCLFREKVFSGIFQSAKFHVGGISLYDTFIDLLRRSKSVTEEDGTQGILLAKGRKSPVDGEALADEVFVPLNPGFVDLRPGSRIYVTDALRIQDVFSEEGSNTECFNRLMSLLEHLMVAHVVRCSHVTDKTITGHMNVIVDGPLAVFGEAARFHKSILSLLHEVRSDCRSKGMRGPLVVGVSKTGKVMEHANLIREILNFNEDGSPRAGAVLLPIDDDYRKTYIEPNRITTTDNFGDETYYGQHFIVRTARGKVFDVTLAYPFASKDPVEGQPFRDAKVNLAHYGEDISQMLSLIDMMQTDLYADALIPVHLAHRYASIAHSPGGRSLDRFVKEALQVK
ncbi:MAG: hypothetical protein JJ969_01290 [Rhizobiaceae bacterium]|nr:hypothetical protein [Rhizobiaceae bacterium]